jgi:FG-GAP repeat
MSGESSFGRTLADFHGDLLLAGLGKAYRYDIQANAIVQSYDHSGGTFNGSNWLTAHGEKIAVGTSAGTGFVQLFDSITGQLLQTYNGSEAGDRFGRALASNGSQLFVGAPELRDGTTYFGYGKVVVIDSLGNRRTILNPEPGTSSTDDESFGYDVGVIGNDLYVGALYDDDGGKVWHIAADTGATLTKYNNPHGSLGNGNRPQFGDSLDVAGKYLLVGANQSSASGTNASGAAYLFDRTTGNLLHIFFDPIPGVLDNFGIDVALVGNFAVIGAHNDGDGKSNGAVFVFDVSTGLHVQTIETPLSSSDFFGLKVQRVGQNWLAVSESTGGGRVHLYSVVPEPSTCTILIATVVAFLSTRRGFRGAD